jgi:multicomponent Na+:H+ antiporter subunit E
MRRRLALGALLVVVWLLLWDEITANQVLAGIVVAALLLLVLRKADAPPTPLVVRPAAVARFAVWFVWQFVVSNAQVVRAVLLPGRWVRPGVVTVPLATSSPTLAAIVSNTCALTPGMQPVALHWRTHTLEVHVLSLTDEPAAVAFLLDLEARIAAAFDPGWSGATPRPGPPGGATTAGGDVS